MISLWIDYFVQRVLGQFNYQTSYPHRLRASKVNAPKSEIRFAKLSLSRVCWSSSAAEIIKPTALSFGHLDTDGTTTRDRYCPDDRTEYRRALGDYALRHSLLYFSLYTWASTQTRWILYNVIKRKQIDK